MHSHDIDDAQPLSLMSATAMCTSGFLKHAAQVEGHPATISVLIEGWNSMVAASGSSTSSAPPDTQSSHSKQPSECSDWRDFDFRWCEHLTTVVACIVAGQRGAVAALLEAAQGLSRLGRDSTPATADVPSFAAQTCKVKKLGLSSCVTCLASAVLSPGQLGWP